MTVPTNRTEALALLTAASPKDITAADIRDVMTWLFDRLDLIETFSKLAVSGTTTGVAGRVYVYDATTPFTFTLPAYVAGAFIAFQGSGAMTIDGAGAETIDGSATLVLSGDDGLVLFGSGGEWKAIRSLADVPNGAVNVHHGTFLGLIGSSSAPSDSEAPTVVSATINAANPDRLVVVYDSVVTVAAVTGQSCTGTWAPAISSILSGSGTTTVTYQLAHPALGGGTETWSYAYDGTNVVLDEASNGLAAGSTSITFVGNFAADVMDNLVADYEGFWVWARRGVVTSSPDIDSIPMVVGGVTAGSVSQATASQKPHLVTIAGRQYAQFIAADSMHMVASQAASQFNFMHRTGGCSSIVGYKFTAGAILGHVFDTGFSAGAVNQTGCGLSQQTDNGNVSGGVTRNGGGVAANQCTVAGGVTANTMTVVSHVWDEAVGGSLQINGGPPTENGPNAAPDDASASPDATYHLGRYGGVAIQHLDMHLAFTIHVKTIIDGADLTAAHEAGALLCNATLA